MTRVRRWVVAVGVLALLGTSGCGDSKPTGSVSDSDGQRPTGTPVTHDESSSEEALISGTLDGTLDCLWLDIGDERHALIVPSGSATQQAGDDVILLDEDGTKVARSGEEVAVTGGFRPAEEACGDADATGPTVVAGEVQSAAS